MFQDLSAWFSDSVDQEIKRAWKDHGGREVDCENALYFFSADSACMDTKRLFESDAYVNEHLAVFHPLYISDCLRVGDQSKVILGNYFFPPLEIKSLIKKQKTFSWENEATNSSQISAQNKHSATVEPNSCHKNKKNEHNIGSSFITTTEQEKQTKQSVPQHQSPLASNFLHRPSRTAVQKDTQNLKRNHHQKINCQPNSIRKCVPLSFVPDKQQHSASDNHTDRSLVSSTNYYHEKSGQKKYSLSTTNSTNNLNTKMRLSNPLSESETVSQNGSNRGSFSSHFSVRNKSEHLNRTITSCCRKRQVDEELDIILSKSVDQTPVNISKKGKLSCGGERKLIAGSKSCHLELKRNFLTVKGNHLEIPLSVHRRAIQDGVTWQISDLQQVVGPLEDFVPGEKGFEVYRI